MPAADAVLRNADDGHGGRGGWAVVEADGAGDVSFSQPRSDDGARHVGTTHSAAAPASAADSASSSLSSPRGLVDYGASSDSEGEVASDSGDDSCETAGDPNCSLKRARLMSS